MTLVQPITSVSAFTRPKRCARARHVRRAVMSVVGQGKGGPLVVQPNAHSSPAERLWFRPEEQCLVVSGSSHMRPLKPYRSWASLETADRAATPWRLASAIIARWGHDCNTARPHSSLGYLTPAANAEVLRSQRPSTLRHGESSAPKPLPTARSTQFHPAISVASGGASGVRSKPLTADRPIVQKSSHQRGSVAELSQARRLR